MDYKSKVRTTNLKSEDQKEETIDNIDNVDIVDSNKLIIRST